MIVHGFINIISQTSSLNENGNPIVSEAILGANILANIRTLKYDKKGSYTDGKFIQSSYEILIEMQEFEADTIKITTNRNLVLGEFQVQSIEFLDFGQKVKIIV